MKDTVTVNPGKLKTYRLRAESNSLAAHVQSLLVQNGSKLEERKREREEGGRGKV